MSIYKSDLIYTAIPYCTHICNSKVLLCLCSVNKENSVTQSMSDNRTMIFLVVTPGQRSG